MKASTLNWRATLLEAFFLVLGVVLALGASNWRENRTNRQRADVALNSIIEELHANHEAVTEAIAYHSHLLDTLSRYMGRFHNEPARFPGRDVFNKGFTNPAVPLSRAFEAASATGVIEFMPYEKVLLISQVYKNQEQYEIQSRSVGQQIYGRMFDQGTDGVLQNYRNLTQIIGSFVYTECGLIAAYAEVLPALKPGTEMETPPFCQYIPRG